MGKDNGINWDLLLKRIAAGKCTPFLGAGASYGHIPLGGTFAAEWAEEYGYPLEYSNDLLEVAQFVSIQQRDHVILKERLAKEIRKAKLPDFTKPDEIYGLLAELPLPIYITTNYDDFMYQALVKKEGKIPVQKYCRWNSLLEEFGESLEEGYKPSKEAPLVFHLHGYQGEPESIVLTEDDYLDFLININKDQNVIPKIIQRTFSGTTLLFLGYSLADIDFRVVFRSMVYYLERSLKRAHVSVQLVPDWKNATKDQRKVVQDYLNKYFSDLRISVYWGTCCEFATELRRQWE